MQHCASANFYLDFIVFSDGVLVKCEIFGLVEVNSHLSGIPDLTLSFANPSILNDVQFHPCVRFRPWESEQILSFVPPDGQFKLMSYRYIVICVCCGIKNQLSSEMKYSQRPKISIYISKFSLSYNKCLFLFSHFTLKYGIVFTGITTLRTSQPHPTPPPKPYF